MIIIQELGACFVANPRTGSLTISRMLEQAFPDRNLFAAEMLKHGHASLADVEATTELPFSVYNARSFAVVRNPYERFMSYCAAFHTQDFQTDPRFTLQQVAAHLLEDGHDYWSAPQGIVTAGVRNVYRYELGDAVSGIAAALGVEVPQKLERLHDSGIEFRYQNIYTNESKTLVDVLYADDLREFDYRF